MASSNDTPSHAPTEESPAGLIGHASALRIGGLVCLLAAVGQMFEAFVLIRASSGAWEVAVSDGRLDQYATGLLGGLAVVGASIGLGFGALACGNALVGYGLATLRRWTAVPTTILAVLGILVAFAGWYGAPERSASDAAGGIVVLLANVFLLYLVWSAQGREILARGRHGAFPRPGRLTVPMPAVLWGALVVFFLSTAATALGIVRVWRDFL
jgi:hypothetical protein